MTLSHDEANARLLDLVYGEAAPDERAALEAHVATCARCQTELEALGDTRARVRLALDDAPVPARAHARILEAARAAVAESAPASNGAAHAGGAAATAAPAKRNEPASRAADAPSFWDRLRGKWALPTLATVGAMAVMLLGAKVFFNPQASLERGKQGIFPKEEAQLGAQEPAAPAPADEREALAKTAREAEPAELGRQDKAARPSRSMSPAARARVESVRGFGGVAGGAGGGKPAFVSDKLRGAPASRAMGGISLGPADNDRGAVAAKKPAKGGRMDDALDGLGSSGSASGGGAGYARPPSGWKADQPAAPAATAAAPAAPPPAPARPKVARKQMSDDVMEGAVNRAAPAPAAAPAAEPSYAEERDEEAPAKRKAAPAADTKAEAKKEAREKDAPAPYEAPARKADELYAAQRWSEAAAAYADLLRRFPTADQAPRWRTRLATAQREVAPATRPAAKATSAPAAH